MFDKVWSELGPIDILVNNAGIETIVPFLELTDEQWTRLTDVNLRSAWLCSQIYCRRVIGEKRKGNIVNIGSIQAAKVLPGRTHYAPTKLGLEALTRNSSAEMTPLGVRINCVHPGVIETDMTAWITKSTDCELKRSVLAQISLGRWGHVREIGTVVAFMASDEASYLTGQSLHVDGGLAGK
jgi:NAD(P)-dependent dehydrogenase (short-subunit alcohol dehydrogenase family)